MIVNSGGSLERIKYREKKTELPKVQLQEKSKLTDYECIEEMVVVLLKILEWINDKFIKNFGDRKPSQLTF